MPCGSDDTLGTGGAGPDDRIVFLGDYIDRAPASREVVDSLLNLSRKCTPVFLRGNHEAMIIDAREDALKANVWQSYGGFEALISYQAEYNQNWATIIPDSTGSFSSVLSDISRPRIIFSFTHVWTPKLTWMNNPIGSCFGNR